LLCAVARRRHRRRQLVQACVGLQRCFCIDCMCSSAAAVLSTSLGAFQHKALYNQGRDGGVLPHNPWLRRPAGPDRACE
jgi:hypothetical protein